MAQNVIWIDSVSSGPSQDLTFSVKVANTQSITAIQLDVNLPSELGYVNESAALTNRASSSHQLAASLVGSNVLRIISYSASADTFFSRSGAVITFKCKSKTEPGSYRLAIINPILSNTAQTNVVSSSRDGKFTLIAPKISISKTAIDFGRVPLYQSSDISVSISNAGNVALNISKLSSISTEVFWTDSSSVTIQPNQIINRTLRFAPFSKGAKAGSVKVTSDDPQKNVITVDYTASGYTINELHIQNRSGRSGTQIQIPFSINNMEAFTSFQFDLILPNVLLYTAGSATLSNRKNDQQVSANVIGDNKLRVVAYSQTNSFFSSDTGKIVTLTFDLNGTAGNYNIGLENVVISNEKAENIVSAFYTGSVNISAPDISCATSVNFGEVSVKDTLSYSLTINNNGNDTLKITAVSTASTQFWCTDTFPQLINAGAIKELKLKFHNTVKGNSSTRLSIRSNDPDEDPFYTNLMASAFAPNYLRIENASARVCDTVTIKLDIDNYEPFVAFQCDLEFPDSLTFLNDGVSLSSRKIDHQISASLINKNKLRLFAFSLSQKEFSGSSGSVAEIKFKVGDRKGTFPLTLSNGIISNSASENIIKSAVDGTIQISSKKVTKTITLDANWNLFSVPLEGENMRADFLFPDASSNVFGFSYGYQIVSTVSTGKGYWIKYDGAKAILITGALNETASIDVSAGWNMIGVYDYDAQVSNITTSPTGIISSNFFGFNNGYQIASTLQSGKGYWIRVSESGNIILNQSVPKISHSDFLSSTISPSWGKIIVEDYSGNKGIVYLTDEQEKLELHSLPPIPPKGIFDVRWSSDRYAETSGKELIISNAVYPIRIKIEGESVCIKNAIDGTILGRYVSNGSIILIANQACDHLLIEKSEKGIPTTFELFQNYPNPFNPSTVIRYQLPVAGKVELKIYDVLGREVERLVDEMQEAGNYEVEWKATKYSSGVYVYRMQAGSYSQTKKLILMK